MDNESFIHVIYEMLSDEENALSKTVLNMLGKYGSLLFVQLNQYARENSVFYNHSRSVKKAKNLLVSLNLIEKVKFKLTTDAFKDKENNIVEAKKKTFYAYALSELGKQVLDHQEGEIASNYLPVLLPEKNKGNFIRCWQIYDFDYLLRQQDSFIQGQVEILNNEIVYHCWLLKSISKKKIAELVIRFPLQSKLLIKDKKGNLKYQNESLKHQAQSFYPKFYGTKELPSDCQEYTIDYYAVIRASKAPVLSNFKTINDAYKGKGQPLVLIGNAYDNGVRFDSKIAGTVIDSYYFYGLKSDKETLFRMKFNG